MRNPNPFTDRQIRLLEAIRDRIDKIDDPDPEVITHESYAWKSEPTKHFGRLPKICFCPYSSHTKGEIILKAGFIDEKKEERLNELRKQYGIKAVKFKKARLFEAEWNNIMFKIKKAVFTVGYLNRLFSCDGDNVAEPVRIMQDIVLEEFSKHFGKSPNQDVSSREKAEIRKNGGFRSYDQELAELE